MYADLSYDGTIQFLPIKHGSEVDLSSTGILGVSGNHKLLGFKPGRAGKREGWLVILVRDGSRSPKRKVQRADLQAWLVKDGAWRAKRKAARARS